MKNLHMMIGITGSGKSTLANQLLNEKEDSILISSDQIKEELFGKEALYSNDKKNHTATFAKYNQLLIENMKKGTKNIISDCTHVGQKRRVFEYNEAKKNGYNVIAHMIFATPEQAKSNQRKRERQLSDEVVDEMFKSFISPTRFVDYDEIKMYGDKWFNGEFNLSKEVLTQVKENDQLVVNEEIKSLILKNYDSHDSYYHFESINEHIELVAKRSREISGNDVFTLAAFFHDLGKSFCKQKTDEYAHYYGHESLSGLYLFNYLYSINQLDKYEDALRIVHNHMNMFNGISMKKRKNYKINDELYAKFVLFNSIDKSCSFKE